MIAFDDVPGPAARPVGAPKPASAASHILLADALVDRPIAPPAGVTLHQALREYEDALRADADSRQIDQHHARCQRTFTRQLRELMPDVPLSAIGYPQVRKLVAYYVGRPVTKKTGRKMAAVTAMNYVQAARRFFSYLADSGAWTPPASFEKCFGYKREKLFTDAELDARQTVQVFTLDELATLWQFAGSDHRRLYFLLALNCGFTQKEIGTLRHSHCHLDAAIPFISRRRNKTRVLGKWRLWPETVQLLKKLAAPPNPDGLALLNEDGNPLVWDNGSLKGDTIGHHHWPYHLKAALTGHDRAGRDPQFAASTVRVRKLGFKHLRKTASDIVRRIDGKDVAETFLCHTDKTLSRLYNNRDFKRLSKALRKMRRRLQRLFDAVPVGCTDSTASSTDQAGATDLTSSAAA